ncbi:MAG: Spy/CpxP family protein refolding chaperone [Candidatus Tantalella remota]|nr:Spy/CpxP family protein refolding chaperone [Candidatus Tantalella remota]
MMKGKMKMMAACVVAASLALSAPAALSQPDRGPRYEEDGEGRKGGRGGGFKETFNKLNLTPEQQEPMKVNREKNREQMKSTKDALRTERQVLRQELQNLETDKAAIDRTVLSMKELQGKMIDQRVEGFLAMKEILTPEQFQKLGERKDARKKGEKSRGKGGKPHYDMF